MSRIVNCAHCGREFHTNSKKKGKLFCSDYCRKASDKPDKLTIDAMNAQKKGMSYGQYMAWKGLY